MGQINFPSFLRYSHKLFSSAKEFHLTSSRYEKDKKVEGANSTLKIYPSWWGNVK